MMPPLSSHLHMFLDPLTLPPRREQCLRKAKQGSIHAMLMSNSGAGGNGTNNPDDQLAEPDEFADSDTDPVWTPQDDDVSVLC